jgi:hypothetical protein
MSNPAFSINRQASIDRFYVAGGVSTLSSVRVNSHKNQDHEYVSGPREHHQYAPGTGRQQPAKDHDSCELADCVPGVHPLLTPQPTATSQVSGGLQAATRSGNSSLGERRGDQRRHDRHGETIFRPLTCTRKSRSAFIRTGEPSRTSPQPGELTHLARIDQPDPAGANRPQPPGVNPSSDGPLGHTAKPGSVRGCLHARPERAHSV